MKRTKSCPICDKKFDVMYRVQYQENRQWVFVCKACVLDVKPKNKNYRYGGTWKG
ncbi:MAG: hypothetical protein P8H38_03160 [Flavobacteriaceae bacterium]|nr:hypothetical protein [Flavobacteriaceae bacterium]